MLSLILVNLIETFLNYKQNNYNSSLKTNIDDKLSGN